MFFKPLGFVNRLEKWPPKPLQRPVFICAACFGSRGDGKEAGSVVVGEFEDEIESGPAEQGGEFQVCHPIAGAAFCGIRVCCGENSIDLGASGENGIA
jgi:hypothetical protein